MTRIQKNKKIYIMSIGTKILYSLPFILTIIFLIALFYIGGLMTRGI